MSDPQKAYDHALTMRGASGIVFVEKDKADVLIDTLIYEKTTLALRVESLERILSDELEATDGQAGEDAAGGD